MAFSCSALGVYHAVHLGQGQLPCQLLANDQVQWTGWGLGQFCQIFTMDLASSCPRCSQRCTPVSDFLPNNHSSSFSNKCQAFTNVKVLDYSCSPFPLFFTGILPSKHLLLLSPWHLIPGVPKLTQMSNNPSSHHKISTLANQNILPSLNNP